MTAAEAIAFLRKLKPPRETIDVLYVTDGAKRLLGRLTLRELILADPQSRISELLNPEVLSVLSSTDKHECARLMGRHDIASLPVVNQDQQLLGIIRLKECVTAAEESATEDMYHMIGLSGHERVFGPMKESIRRRLPWLCLNLGTAILAALVVNAFESTITQVVALAVFIPIIAGQGANAGSQTLTIIVRSLALGEVTMRNARRALFKEIGLAVVNGMVVALVAGTIGFLWKNDVWLAVVLASAIFLTMLIAGLSGALVPLGLKMMRIDPALASTVVVTTVTDVGGFLALLGLATLLMQYLE